MDLLNSEAIDICSPTHGLSVPFIERKIIFHEHHETGRKVDQGLVKKCILYATPTGAFTMPLLWTHGSFSTSRVSYGPPISDRHADSCCSDRMSRNNELSTTQDIPTLLFKPAACALEELCRLDKTRHVTCVGWRKARKRTKGWERGEKTGKDGARQIFFVADIHQHRAAESWRWSEVVSGLQLNPSSG